MVQLSLTNDEEELSTAQPQLIAWLKRSRLHEHHAEQLAGIFSGRKLLLAGLKQNSKLCSRQRPAEEVPLSFLTMAGLKVGPLFLRFDALGDHHVLEALSHANDRVHDG